MGDPTRWTNHCPGDLADTLPEVEGGDPAVAVRLAAGAFPAWRDTPLPGRRAALEACRDDLAANKESLAALIAREVGKPLREARLEIDAAIAKFGFAFDDAAHHLADRVVNDGPHPALVRTRPRGPAAVIAPFNFPVHLGHGAAVGYLLAGNPVLLKPSPLAANVGAAYGAIMARHLPPGVMQTVQGWGETGKALCMDPRVRSVCFTGSLPAGRALAVGLAGDFSKSVALELGGRNCLVVCESADLSAAATAAADGLCLTAGQRCNATNRILVQASVASLFAVALEESLRRYVPGDPRSESTMLGPVVSAAAIERYRQLTATGGRWLVPGWSESSSGYFVKPAILRTNDPLPFGETEAFCPVATFEIFSTPDEAIRLQAADIYGLTASVFTEDHAEFDILAGAFEVGNLYRNLPTTFSPSTLPFGGALLAGNGKPGGRGFARFAATEQAVQWKA